MWLTPNSIAVLPPPKHLMLHEPCWPTTRIPIKTYWESKWFVPCSLSQMGKSRLSPCSHNQVTNSRSSYPWQNKGRTTYPFPRYKPAQYRYETVPNTARNLKNMNGPNEREVRIMLVGVPNRYGRPPAIGYWSGSPNPSNVPKNGDQSMQCVQRIHKIGRRRRKVRDCRRIQFPPFPIVSIPVDRNVFGRESWEPDALSDRTIDELCEILPTPHPTTLPTPLPSAGPSVTPTFSPSNSPSASAPSVSPSTQPTNSPSNYPTQSPTTSLPTNNPSFSPTTSIPTSSPSNTPSKHPTHLPTANPSLAPSVSPTPKRTFDQLDLFVFLDQSRSMRWRAQSCRTAPEHNQNAPDVKVCWELFLDFVRIVALRATQIKYNEGRTEIGWQDDFPEDLTKGLRIWVLGFYCKNRQKVPQVTEIAKKVTNYDDFVSALNEARGLIPDGGTCPSAAMQRALGYIMAGFQDEGNTRPYKFAMLFTDGVFYDGSLPKVSSQGFHALDVITMAFAIAPGLTEKPVAAKQLLGFTNQREDRVYNLANGFSVLDDIANVIVSTFPGAVNTTLPRVFDKPYYCGSFTNDERCLFENPEGFRSIDFCKWLPSNPAKFTGNGRCVSIVDTPCQRWRKTNCKRDQRYCRFKSGKCRDRVIVNPSG